MESRFCVPNARKSAVCSIVHDPFFLALYLGKASVGLDRQSWALGKYAESRISSTPRGSSAFLPLGGRNAGRIGVDPTVRETYAMLCFSSVGQKSAEPLLSNLLSGRKGREWQDICGMRTFYLQRSLGQAGDGTHGGTPVDWLDLIWTQLVVRAGVEKVEFAGDCLYHTMGFIFYQEGIAIWRQNAWMYMKKH